MRDFAMGVKESHTLDHSAFSGTLLSPWVRNLKEKITRYLASTSINAITPSFVQRSKVQGDTLHIAPLPFLP